MKVTYEFNDKDDNYSLEIFQQAIQMYSALNQIKQEFRQLGKYKTLEYFKPKQARQTIVGEGDAPVQIVISDKL